jgi:hypothetical protein
MKAIDKVMIEMKMWQYFSEFSKEGLTVSIFKERHETPAENGGNYLSIPEYDTNYYSEFFDEFFTKKLNKNKRPYKSFINHEIITFQENFKVLIKDPELRIVDDWIFHLNEMLNSEKDKPQIIENSKRKNIAKEYALAYIFDLHVKSKRIPINRIEGSLAKNEIIEISIRSKQFHEHFSLETVVRFNEMEPFNNANHKLYEL